MLPELQWYDHSCCVSGAGVFKTAVVVPERGVSVRAKHEALRIHNQLGSANALLRMENSGVACLLDIKCEHLFQSQTTVQTLVFSLTGLKAYIHRVAFDRWGCWHPCWWNLLGPLPLPFILLGEAHPAPFTHFILSVLSQDSRVSRDSTLALALFHHLSANPLAGS